jgi:hypothetical protein
MESCPKHGRHGVVCGLLFTPETVRLLVDTSTWFPRFPSRKLSECYHYGQFFSILFPIPSGVKGTKLGYSWLRTAMTGHIPDFRT